MSGIKCRLMGTAADVQIKKDKMGKEYMILLVQTEETGGERVWIVTRRDVDKLCERIAPGRQLYIEGAIALKRWEDENKKPHSALVVEASHVEVMFSKDETDVEKEEKKTVPAYIGPAPKHRKNGSKSKAPNDKIPF